MMKKLKIFLIILFLVTSILKTQNVLATSVWQNVGTPGFSAGEADFPSLALSSEGTPYIAYEDGGDGPAIVKKFNGTDWETVGASFGGTVYNLFLAFDGNIPYVACRDDNSNIFIEKFNGTSWEIVGSSDITGENYANSGSVTLAFHNHTLYVAYSDTSPEYDVGPAIVKKFNGTSWVNVGNPDFSAGEADSTSLALSSDGTPYVAYIDYGNSFKTTVMKFNGTSWENVGNVGFSAGRVGYISLTLSSDDTPYVVYQDGANGYKATAMKYNGTSWVNVGDAGFSAGGAPYTSLALSSDGTPYVAYTDNGNSGKATVKKFNGTSWISVGDAGFSAGGAPYTSLALSSDGTPYVAYTDYVNDSKATVMKFAPTIEELTSFDSITDIQAGYPGHTIYSTAQEVINSLPTEVSANNGAVSVPVTTWEDTDSYNPNQVGSYTFTAVLGDIPSGYINTGNYTATVEVIITPETKINISSCTDFENINNDLNGSYLLTTNLNCTGEGSNIMIGYMGCPKNSTKCKKGPEGYFTGIFNGQNHYINIAINNTEENNIGLFRTAYGANISNLIINGIVHGGENYVGGLVGYGTDLNITNVTNNALITGGNYIGGLIGQLTTDLTGSTITNSHSSSNVSGTQNNIGGLVGYTSAQNGNITISNSTTSGTIDGNSDVGGLIGDIINSNENTTAILNSSSTSSIIGYGSDIGGLVGHIEDAGNYTENDPTTVTIDNSYHTGSVSGYYNAGGLVGNSGTSATATFNLTNSYAMGNISGGGGVGGLIGNLSLAADDSANANITNNHFSGDINSTNSSSGGIIGYIYLDSYSYTIPTNLTISNNYSTGTIAGSSNVGGLIGCDEIYNESDSTQPLNLTINRNYSTATVNGTGNYVGGLIGSLYLDNYTEQPFTFTFNQNYANSTILGSSCIGGLIGCLYSSDDYDDGTRISGTLSQNYFTGTVTATASNSYTAGLIGSSEIYGNPFLISDSYVNADITGYYYVGGLLGNASNVSITNSYTTGTVRGSGSFAGGLVGRTDNGTSITNSFSTSTISDFAPDTMGGIIGNIVRDIPALTNTFYDQTSTGQMTCTSAGDLPEGCTAINTVDSPNTTYFKGNKTNPPLSSWDFDTIWRTNANGYPTLQYFNPIIPDPDPEPIPVVVHGGGGGGYIKPPTNTPPVTPPITSTTTPTCPNGNTKESNCTKAPIITTTTNTPNTNTATIFTKNILPNTKGTEVKKLQELLKNLGYLKVTPNGYYGSATRAAVKKYQKDHNIPQTGIVGPLTRKALGGK